MTSKRTNMAREQMEYFFDVYIDDVVSLIWDHCKLILEKGSSPKVSCSS